LEILTRCEADFGDRFDVFYQVKTGEKLFKTIFELEELYGKAIVMPVKMYDGLNNVEFVPEEVLGKGKFFFLSLFFSFFSLSSLSLQLKEKMSTWCGPVVTL
jgi:hypothetical protein